jgi:hypothetical protein
MLIKQRRILLVLGHWYTRSLLETSKQLPLIKGNIYYVLVDYQDVGKIRTKLREDYSWLALA